MSKDKVTKERIALKLRMQNLRENRTAEEVDYKKICNKHNMRKSRENRSGKDRLIENLKAKKGMRRLSEKGRILDHQIRTSKNITEMEDWNSFKCMGQTYSELLSNEKPDIVERLNNEARDRKEKERKEKEAENITEKEGQWNYDGESGEYYWTGEKEPEYGDTFAYEPPTEEEKEMIREAERREFEWFVENRETDLKEKRKQKQIERKQKMETAIDPLPERELCPYEKIREDIINEREKAMVDSGFFEDLINTKREIGLLKDTNEKDKDTTIKTITKKNQKKSLKKAFSGKDKVKVVDMKMKDYLIEETEVIHSEKEVKSDVKTKKDQRINEGENRKDNTPDYCDLYKSDAWLYFEME